MTGDTAAPATDAGPDLAGLVRAAVHAELDQILPYVVDAIKKNNAFDEMKDRLGRAERVVAARRERPLAVAVHRLLIRLRHLDFDQAVKASLDTELVKILTEAGFEEIGRVGEDYDPARHDALGGRVIDGNGTVTEVDARGLGSFGDIVVRAQVQVAPHGNAAPAATAAAKPATEPASREQ
jgi:hypothetical protein